MASKFNPLRYDLPPNTRACLFQDPKQLSSPPKTPIQDPKLIINGGSTLSGHVSISGSKNSALPILAATLCCSGSSNLKNVPCLSDTRTMASILKSLGAQVTTFNGEIVVNTDGLLSLEPDSTEIGKLRGGFFVLGPLLARFGEATVGLPGGCDIGARPIDLYIHGFQALGATVELRLVNSLIFYYVFHTRCLHQNKQFNLSA